MAGIQTRATAAANQTRTSTSPHYKPKGPFLILFLYHNNFFLPFNNKKTVAVNCSANLSTRNVT